MPRPAKHDEIGILNAAATLVAARGPSAATITAISHAMGAPSGSIYHRFRSRDELLGRLWLTKAQSFQNRWAQALNKPDPRLAGLEAALALPRAVRDDFEGARIMVLHRREDFLAQGWPAEMQKEARRLGEQVEEVLASITRRLFGRNTASARQRRPSPFWICRFRRSAATWEPARCHRHWSMSSSPRGTLPSLTAWESDPLSGDVLIPFDSRLTRIVNEASGGSSQADVAFSQPQSLRMISADLAGSRRARTRT